jgi:hypothetical protein
MDASCHDPAICDDHIPRRGLLPPCQAAAPITRHTPRVRAARLLRLAIVVWVPTHPILAGVALVAAATGFLAWATRPAQH